MSILIDQDTRVVVQGMTGRLGRSETERMMAYGTNVVAGVTPGKGGTSLFGVPVFDTVEEAVAARAPNTAANFVPARFVLDSALEVIEAGIPLLTISAERIPQHDTSRILAAARRSGVKIVGPNTQGIASPGKSMIGGIGGLRPDEFLMEGGIGVVSKSGGMGGEICWLLTSAGLGQSTYVSTGGELMLGTTFSDALELFESDNDTQAVVLFGEAGSTHEIEVAEMVASGRFSKPLFAIIAGRFAERMPGVTFGHGGTIINDNRSTPSVKEAILEESGVSVLRRLSEIVPAVSAVT